MVRIEKELKHQRELIKTILEKMDKRFEAVESCDSSACRSPHGMPVSSWWARYHPIPRQRAGV